MCQILARKKGESEIRHFYYIPFQYLRSAAGSARSAGAAGATGPAVTGAISGIVPSGAGIGTALNELALQVFAEFFFEELHPGNLAG